MQHNSSISQAFMVMSFTAAGLLLTAQLSGDRTATGTSRNRGQTQPSTLLAEGQPNLSDGPERMAIAPPNHLHSQAGATQTIEPDHHVDAIPLTVARSDQPTPNLTGQRPSVPFPFSIVIAPIQVAQAVTDRISHFQHPPGLTHNELIQQEGQPTTTATIVNAATAESKKEGTQATDLRPTSDERVNSSMSPPINSPFLTQESGDENHQQTEHTLAKLFGRGRSRRQPSLALNHQASSHSTPQSNSQLAPINSATENGTTQSITIPNQTDHNQRQQELTTARLVVDLSDRQLTVHHQNQEALTYEIAVGKAGWETPLGEFTVTDKDPNPLWRHPLTGELVPAGGDSPLGSRWIGFWSDGIHQIGFHGTNQSQSIGQAISHGCIRLHDADIQELYDQVALGTSVIVQP